MTGNSRGKIAALWCMIAACTPGLPLKQASRPDDGDAPRFLAVPAGETRFQGGGRVAIAAFVINESAITVAQYARCASVGACSPPRRDKLCNPDDRLEHPRDCVSWTEAQAYCQWIGARLVTDQEREYVGTGLGAGWRYPWGNDEPQSRACWNGDGNSAGRGARTTSCRVGEHRSGDSPLGGHDLAGNVAEWTASDYDNSKKKVVRGGSWADEDPEALTGTHRLALDPGAFGPVIGFRCARGGDLVRPLAPAAPVPPQGSPAERLPDQVHHLGGEVEVEAKTHLQFVYIPGSAGDPRAGTTAGPSPFWLTATLVTLEAYSKCVDAGVCADPGSGGACNWGTERRQHPINCVDWHHADTFCKWLGGRVPTNIELEFVAKGGDEGRRFPWGSEEPATQACWNGAGNEVGRGRRAGTCEVGSHKAGSSRWGLQDISGNVLEWTATDFSEVSKVVRGGAWDSEHPGWLEAGTSTGVLRQRRTPEVGFRCAR
jgi:formylglycine-generating enzyme required for sulfatase activity